MQYPGRSIHYINFYAWIYGIAMVLPCMGGVDTVAKSDQEVCVVVLVHGIMGIAPHINLQNIGLFIRDELVDTVYARAVHRMRKDEYFYRDQPMQKFGLVPIELEGFSLPGNASALFATIYDRIDKTVSKEPHRNVFYTYGWSGLLSKYQRYIESEGLLIGLYQLIESYKALGIHPKIRLIGYSHGGNVCLNLARMHAAEYPDMEMVIDELITIGMPVQMETDIYADSPIFKKIYNIYSNQDVIQKMDFFSCNRLFSNRQFTSRRSFHVPEQVTQINIKISRLKKTRMPRTKVEKLCKNGLKTSTRSGQRRLLRDASPGHLELWFFGWTADKYRAHFPLYPLPTAVFIPYLIALAEEHADEIHNPYPCTIDLRPELGYTIIAQRTKCACWAYQVPFIEESLFNECCAQASAAEPEYISNAAYQRRIDEALKEACKEYDAAKQPPVCSNKAKKGRRRGCSRRKHKKARALPSHYKFLEPLS